MNFHFLFEQSGTFKNVFKQFDHNCFDYDILNDYGQTDFVLDLFREIEFEYENVMYNRHIDTIFSNMTPQNDFIIAFFPCTHFCDFNSLTYRLYIRGKKRDFNAQKVDMLIKRNQDRARFFEIYLKFCYICSVRGFRTIIENPASGFSNNYLSLFSPVDISYVERNRLLFGDNFIKPTNYFAINFSMVENFQFFTDFNFQYKTIMKTKSKSCSTGYRSLITSTYAKNFYKRFIELNI